MKIVVTPYYHAEAAWIAADDNYGGPPEHCGTGATPLEAVADLLAWLGLEDDAPYCLDVRDR